MASPIEGTARRSAGTSSSRLRLPVRLNRLRDNGLPEQELSGTVGASEDCMFRPVKENEL